ncbi:1-acyl-sn-glycerol-3-phosphate acyltransferase alpha-like [Cotesia typhae]|uniref:1-acyl-sn-glycerol-3-phosphate acyltransferase alpha-like n=1 Tax=Cotesia typhae TaxID=2053667 RepID=UPI003D697177
MDLRAIFTLIIISVMVYLYRRNNVMKYYTKFVIFHGFFISISFILVPILLFRPRNMRNWMIVSKICGFVGELLGLELEVRNLEDFRRKKGCIVVSNHQSSLDVLGLFKIGQLVNNNCGVVAKKELFYIWPPGLVIWLCGSIFIDRKNPYKARSDLNAVAEKVKKENVKLWIFPEGTRRNNGKINSFKKGAFHMAVNAKLDIVPIVFSSYYFLENKKRFDSGKVIITALPAVSTENSSVEEVMDKIHLMMGEAFVSSSAEAKLAVKS